MRVESMGCLQNQVGRAAAIVALFALAIAPGCGRQPPRAAPARPVEVLVERPGWDTIRDYEDFTGRTEA
ncbi:MAG TPA: hypothetical protein VF590_26255, partial [Isosphaeraceae bacterium]